MKIGVLGAGQLGRMLALAGIPHGHSFRFWDPTANSPASCLGEHIVAGFDQLDSVRRFVEGLDVVTYEFENVPVALVQAINEHVAVYPPVKALHESQDRFLEKSMFRNLGLSTPKFKNVQSLVDLRDATWEFGFPCVLKTRRMGYDGKGQILLKSADDIQPAWDELGSQELILESYVTFSRELSIIGVRSTDGTTAFYDLFENTHRNGILRRSISPADASAHLQPQCEQIAKSIMDHLEYVGVMALELFDTAEGIVINEMAPRVHNSGHGTIEGNETSQFENHIRAICGSPVGSVLSLGQHIMINCIGKAPDPSQALSITGCHLHLYGKEDRIGRKVGHVTFHSRNVLFMKTRDFIEARMNVD